MKAQILALSTQRTKQKYLLWKKYSLPLFEELPLPYSHFYQSAKNVALAKHIGQEQDKDKDNNLLGLSASLLAGEIKETSDWIL